MKKIFSILIILLFFTAVLKAQPGWTVNPADYTYNMTITGAVNLDYVESTDANDMVGAFIGGECRGVVNLVQDAGSGRYLAYLMVYSNNVSGTINFKIWDDSNGAEVEIPVTHEFSVNGIIGSTEAPYIFSNPTLSSEAEMLSFNIPSQVGGTTFNGNDISIAMPFGTDLTSLIADFTTSPYAYVEVGGLAQTSGVTANNFSSPVEYLVRSADETAEQTYTVTVSLANAVPTDIYLSDTEIAETATPGETIGEFSTEDGNLDDSHTYSFVSGTGDTDNGSFNISGNLLKLNADVDYETKTSYSVRIQTDDNSGGVFEKPFTISVLDVNDEIPQVTSASITLPETETLQAVHTIVASDADITPAFKVLNYSITGGNEAGKFSIHSTDGVVSLIQALDYETTEIYELEISVTDGTNTGIGNLTINISDENDETPVVTDAEEQILETTLVGEEITQVHATDADAGSNLEFSITGGNTGSAFDINQNTGMVTLANALDYETTTSYTLEISVSDGINTGTGNLTVNIVDVNDESPQITDDNVSISESTLVSTAIYTVSAADADANSNIEYSIVFGNTDNHFGINTTTGVIRVLSALDFEYLSTYYITIAAFDGNNSGTGTITISLTDENDEVPNVTDETVIVSETENIGYSVTNVQATDADANSSFEYFITSGNNEGKFAIDQASGEITLAETLNYETASAYTLGIRVSDGVNNGTGEITVNVQAINDEFPEVSNATVNLEESAIFGQIVHTVVATDPDGGSVLEYSITDGNTASAFAIDPEHGIVTVLGDLDYETTASYSLEITVDDGLHQSSGILTVNLLNENDEVPEVSSDEVSINESSAVGMQVHTVSAFDPDGTSPLEYTIIAGNAGGTFEIESTTGIISVAASLDYETVTSYQLTIGASDGTDTGNGTISINIIDENDETPVVNSGTVYIDETLEINEQIFAVQATDADEGTTLTYSITGGNSEGKFSIDSSTGIITLQEALDYETTTSYSIQVTVNDGAESISANIEVNILDKNDEIPQMQDASVYVPEDESLGYMLHTMLVSDADEGSSFTFEISDGNDEAKFSINEYLGVVVLSGNLDFENRESYTIQVSVSDGVHTTTANLFINVTDVDDNAPVVEDAEIYLAEDAEIGEIVHTVTASDADAISVLNYSIFGGNIDDVFLINPSSGAITLQANIDFESLTDYVLQVNVTDNTNTTSGIVTIHIEDVNDEIPVFADTTLTVSEFSDLGTFIGQVSATDADADSQLSFSIALEDDEGVFELSPEGELSLGDYLDFEIRSGYTLTVEVYDGINTGIGTLSIEITDEDESLFNAVNVFSPNDDGVNDYWELENSHIFRDCDFLIFNNLGEIVYESTGYNNDWDGTYKGVELPIGTYYFVVKCPNCSNCNNSGSISIIR